MSRAEVEELRIMVQRLLSMLEMPPNIDDFEEAVAEAQALLRRTE